MYRDSGSSTQLKERLVSLVATERLALKLFRHRKPTWFLTWTFRDQTDNPTVAVARLKCWLSTWNRHSALDPFRSLLWSAERHVMGSVHIHALSVGPEQALLPHCRRCENASSRQQAFQRLKESWAIHHGWCRCFPYRDDIGRGGMTYVAKYILDPRCLDWGIWYESEDF